MNIETEAREHLERKFGSKLEEKRDFRHLVTYVPNKREPVHSWFAYKEGFSRRLVEVLLKELNIDTSTIVFDPFVGCGTTLVAAKDLGYTAVGIDVLPLAVFATMTKIAEYQDIGELANAVKTVLHEKGPLPLYSRFADVPIVNKGIPTHYQRELLYYRDMVLKYDSPTKEFLLLGLLNILEKVSFTRKDGQFLRLVKKPLPSVSQVLERQLLEMYKDLTARYLSTPKRPKGRAEVYMADARTFNLPTRYQGKVGAVITSPPYLNRYDYSRTYSLELCLQFVKNFEELRTLRHSLLRSHIESKEHVGKEIDFPPLNEILYNLSAKTLNNARIPIMIKGYFEDMNLVISRLREALKAQAPVALVVANARFEGELIPVDLMLSELAERHGFTVERIWVTRYKGNSSQQMGKYGRVPARESIVFWRKI